MFAAISGAKIVRVAARRSAFECGPATALIERRGTCRNLPQPLVQGTRGRRFKSCQPDYVSPTKPGGKPLVSGTKRDTTLSYQNPKDYSLCPLTLNLDPPIGVLKPWTGDQLTDFNCCPFRLASTNDVTNTKRYLNSEAASASSTTSVPGID